MISDTTKTNIIDSSRIEDVIGDFTDLKKSGKDFEGECPMCRTGKLKVNVKKKIYKCFSCDFGGNSAVSYLMDAQKMNYPDALKYLADKYNIIIEEEPRGPQRKHSKNSETYCSRMLRESGLTEDDVKASVFIDGDTHRIVDVFEPRTIDQYGNIVHGNDIIIWYFDLSGKPVKFQKPRSQKQENFYRMRWQNPDLHLDKNGKPKKYETPYGAGSHVYIPQTLRSAYRDARQIKRLYIQEGEKKAEKACKHGMMSVGINGIHNIAHNKQLPYEIELIIARCDVKEVIFWLDADWDDLSNKLQPDKPVEERPLSFYYAVKNYRDYFCALANQGIYLEIFFAHGLDKDFKGIDDLLHGKLKGKEEALREDIDKAINEKSGEGEHCTIHKISTMSELKLREMWNLQSVEAFTKRYKEQLDNANMKEFMYGKHRWRFDENGKPTLAQAIQEDEQFWKTIPVTDKDGKTLFNKYIYKYTRGLNFLRNRGFGRFNMVSGKYEFVKIDQKVVSIVQPYEIRDYMMEIAEQVCEEDVRDMLLRGGKMYFGPDNMSNLPYMRVEFQDVDRDYQYLYFKNHSWKINTEGIEAVAQKSLQKYVWKDKINDFDAAYEEDPYWTITFGKNEDGSPDRSVVEKIELTDKGRECHFLRFLENTSNFYWQKQKDKEALTPEEVTENSQHMVSKLTAVGYLLHSYRNKSCEKAVICMDGKMSEVGESWGRSGKSLFGMAIGAVIPQAYIGAKSKNLTEDPFWAEEVTEKTDNIFLDDVRANIDFEFFFPIITGRLTINVKGQKKFTLPENKTPKVLLTTNHSINGDSSSFRDRQFNLAFSDFYNEEHKPVDDFQTNFFVEWDYFQWNKFYNLMAKCLQLYFQLGLSNPPVMRLEMRRRRQFLGEDFITWAHEYFGTSDDGDPNLSEFFNPERVNQRISRKDMFDSFIDRCPNQRKFISAHKFKKKIMAFCDFKGLRYNPHIEQTKQNPLRDDKRGGVEFFTVANNRFEGVPEPAQPISPKVNSQDPDVPW